MSSTKPHLHPATVSHNFDVLFPTHKLAHAFNSKAMWRNFAKQVTLRAPNLSLKPFSFSRSCSFLVTSYDSFLTEKCKFRPFELSCCKNVNFSEVGFCRKGGSLSKEAIPISGCLSNQAHFNGLCHKGYASLAEAEVTTQDGVVEISFEQVMELVEQMRKEEERVKLRLVRQKKVEPMPGLSRYRYQMLKNRQLKLETESWQQAANEYKELLDEMCKHKLVPNLPYVKSLFLDWFEPLRAKIVEDQELVREGKCRASYAPYFDHLPADMMSIITMHKLMGLLMTGSDYGTAKVVHAACAIGEAIEQEARIHKFLEKTNKKKGDQDKTGEEAICETVVREEKGLRKNLGNLMKKQKRRQLLNIVSSQDDFKPWGAAARAKVGSRLIELLVNTAYIQSPANQLADDPPDFRPAFVHTLRTVGLDNKKTGRRYGMIQCDPLIVKGLEKTPRHMVIPYMPMLVPPVKWTDYDKGAHLALKSYVMRTHGSRKQQEAVKRVPKNQLESVFEALDTLGSIKWRVNNKVLSVVDRIWASGGRLAGLVDRDDVPLPEEPDTEDESELKKWKWKVRSVKKENRERHSLRCDIELKLAVARKMRDEEGFFYPHNIDFRGRAYPMHPYLNHLGNDMCRGMLEFAEGRPLGKSGLRWLKIHLANLYAGGIDKLSHEGRIAFAENHLDDIFDSADRPLEGKRWWLEAEDPFQCLAVCIDLAAALRSRSPETFISHIPVHQASFEK